MGRISAARRRHADLGGIGPGVCNEFRHCLRWNGWVHRYHKRPLDNPNDCDVADEIEAEVVIEGRVNSGSGSCTKKCIPIGGARTTASVATLLAAPARFSMMNG